MKYVVPIKMVPIKMVPIKMVPIWAVFAAVVMPASVVSQLTCPADTRVCPTNKPVTNSPFELVYSRAVTRSRETPLANLIVGSSKAFLAARHPMALAVSPHVLCDLPALGAGVGSITLQTNTSQ